MRYLLSAFLLCGGIYFISNSKAEKPQATAPGRFIVIYACGDGQGNITGYANSCKPGTSVCTPNHCGVKE